MSDTQLVRDLFDIPEQIRKGDFVHKLSEGIDDPAKTAREYVVTPGLAEAFDRSLTLVGSALRDGNSHAAYLHGSFGSGKSHFMALLSLLLRGNEEAWRLPALHELRACNGDRKIIAGITDTETIERILGHIDEPLIDTAMAPARAPPQLDFWDSGEDFLD